MSDTLLRPSAGALPLSEPGYTSLEKYTVIGNCLTVAWFRCIVASGAA